MTEMSTSLNERVMEVKETHGRGQALDIQKDMGIEKSKGRAVGCLIIVV